jgi:hypothetical protein
MTKHLLYGPRRTARIETYLSLHPNDRLIEYLGKNYDAIERTIARTESMEFTLGVIRQNRIRDRDGNEVTLETLTNVWETMNAAILRGFGRQNPSPGFPDLRGPVPPWRERPRYKWPVVRRGRRRHDDAPGDPSAGETGHETAGDGEPERDQSGYDETGKGEPRDPEPGNDEPPD